ncbi:hypothetical protein Poli38472_003831 [Pythium oligandrum]|uniref:Adhesin domain-containing protein n=1 Tax=Pythium oligandrum TaxID=41045 RepID=A0A8K1CLY5_PYTOL|nr:hypothetical protein Poli38472_003831 [Pythium oligandrum]|eukprot:TMW66066.1 hypothetical protein Poli38472_003831 [Pythium oligandrum]
MNKDTSAVVGGEGKQAIGKPIAARQKFKKVWTHDIVGEILPSRVDHLILSGPGLTFISASTSGETKVKVSAETIDMTSAVDVKSHEGSGLIIKPAMNFDHQYVLTEVQLPLEYALKAISNQGSGTVVVEDKVLVANGPHSDIQIKQTGSGVVRVNSHTPLHVESLDISLTGSGDMQFVSPQVIASKFFSSKITSSGNIRVFVGQLNAPKVKLQSTGSGTLQLAALHVDAKHEVKAALTGSGSIHSLGDVLSTQAVSGTVTGSGALRFVAKDEFITTQVQSLVIGSGSITFGSLGAQCAKASYKIAGSGTINATDFAAQFVEAKLRGSGDTTFRASEEIHVSDAGSGRAFAVSPLPPRVSGRIQTVEAVPSCVDELLQHRSTPRTTPTASNGNGSDDDDDDKKPSVRPTSVPSKTPTPVPSKTPSPTTKTPAPTPTSTPKPTDDGSPSPPTATTAKPTSTPKPTTSTPTPANPSPVPTTKTPVTTPSPTEEETLESPSPPPPTQKPVTAAPASTRTPQPPASSSDDDNEVPAPTPTTRAPAPTPSDDDDASPPPVTRIPTKPPAPTTHTPAPLSFDDGKSGEGLPDVVAPVKPASESEEDKKDITLFNESSQIPTPADPFAIIDIKHKTATEKPTLLEVGGELESATVAPVKYVRGRTEYVVGESATTTTGVIIGGTVVDDGSDTGETPRVIGGRQRTDPTNANTMSASSAAFHDTLRFSSCAFAGVSLALLLFFQFTAVDGTMRWTGGWSPNTWEFAVYVAYLQQMSSISQITLIKTPYFLWDFTDPFAWTSFLIQSDWSSSNSLSSDVESAGARRLTTVIIGGIVAYADRLGSQETDILTNCVVAIGVVVAVLLLAFILSAYFVRRNTESSQYQDSTISTREQVARIQRLRIRSSCVLGLCVLVWFMTLYPLGLYSSFEISMEIQAGLMSTVPLLVATFALVGVSSGGLAYFIRIIWVKDSNELQKPMSLAVYGSLYGHFKYRSRLFFVLTCLVQVLSGITIGSSDAEPNQLIGAIAIQAMYLALVFIFSPFRLSLAKWFTYALGVVKIVNYCLAFAFLYSNDSLSSNGRHVCAEVYIALNSIIIIAWFVRLIGVFIAFMRTYVNTRESLMSPEAALEPLPAEQILPPYRESLSKTMRLDESRNNGPPMVPTLQNLQEPVARGHGGRWV